MIITSVSVEGYRLPPASVWEDATNKVDALEFVIVRLEASGGHTGVGFTYSVDIGGAAIATLIETYLAPLVIGMDALDHERIWSTLHRQSRRLGDGVNAMAIAAIDIAVWDLKGKHAGLPLYRLLGGARSEIASYISEINLGADDTADDLLRRVDDYIGRGFRAVKIKIGRDDLEDDIDRIARVSEKLKSGGRLFVDLNQKWTSAEAMQKAPALDRFNLGWIEEPMIRTDIAGHRQLRRAIRTPLALGESLYGRAQFLEYLKAEAVDFVQADVAFVGGVTEWLKIAHLAEAFGKQVAPHYMMELSVHLLCGVPNGYMLEDVVGGSFTELGLLAEPVVVSDARGIPSEKPGHGIVFDADALARHRFDPATIAATFRGGSK